MAFVYKILMNALYGRLGINTKSTVAVICSPEEHKKIEDTKKVVSADPLTAHKVLCSYWEKPKEESGSHWFPKLAAVQIAAAITALGRASP